jgi:hypothetical protein
MNIDSELNFNVFRNHYSECDRQVTLEQFQALTSDELDALILDAKLNRPNVFRKFQLYLPNPGCLVRII